MLFSKYMRTMTTARKFIGILAVVVLVRGIAWGQIRDATNQPALSMPGAEAVTNAPAIPFRTDPQLPPLIRPQQSPAALAPQQPAITVPQAVPVQIPSAAAPAPAFSPAAAPPLRPMPLNIPTTRDLITKSMASAPGGSRDRLNAVSSGALLLTPTNSAGMNGSGLAFPPADSNTDQTNYWRHNGSTMDGVTYH